MSTLDEMWARIEAHQPIADKRGYGTEWAKMRRERTPRAAFAAQRAAEWAVNNAEWAATSAEWAAAWAMTAIESINKAEDKP